MKTNLIIYTLLLFTAISCKKKESKSINIAESKIKLDTTKLYQKTTIKHRNEEELISEYEAYISKENDTIWNQWKFYKNGIIDSSKSKFYHLSITGKKGDSVFKGILRFFSPADSIPNSRIHSRTVQFSYFQKENDSLICKEIESDQNIIYFDYKDFDNFTFEGFLSDLRFIKLDSTDEKLLLNRNYFAVDSKVSTNNTFVELLK